MILALKDNQPNLADSLRDFFVQFKAAPDRTPHAMSETVEKDHGRIETRRCYAFDQLACLHKPEQWPDLNSFAVIESQREINSRTTLEHRYYLSSLAPDANRLLRTIRAHWRVLNTGRACLRHLWRRQARQSITGSRRLPSTVSMNSLPSGRGDSKPTALVHGCCLRRRSNARSHRTCRPQFRRT